MTKRELEKLLKRLDSSEEGVGEMIYGLNLDFLLFQYNRHKGDIPPGTLNTILKTQD